MAPSDIQLLTGCIGFTLSHSREVQRDVLSRLQKSGETTLVSALCMLRLQCVILAIGMFSFLESLLQSGLNWDNPFDILPTYLEAAGRPDIARRFVDYKLAINVLKHGRGRSYEELLARTQSLDFKIKMKDEAFFSEGDVSEVEALVDADDVFVERCAALIEQIYDVIRLQEGAII